MNKTAHSPAPWIWDTGEYDCGSPCTVDGCLGHYNNIPTSLDPVGIWIEEYPEDIEQWKRDACLIEAAPLLLKACEDAYAAIKTLPMEALGISCGGGIGDSVTNWSIRDELLCNLGDAIDKARKEIT